MLIISKYKKQIQALKPLDGGCKYRYENWANHFKKRGLLDCVDEYNARKITRNTVIKSYREYFKNSEHGLEKPFLLTMIWGFDATGYGPFRTNAYLSDRHNCILIANSLNSMVDGDVDSAYLSLKGIKGLGMSYISKVLYFAGKARKLNKYPLIFDIRVARALVSLSSRGAFNRILNITPVNSLKSYSEYNSLLHNWAEKLEVDADQIEYFLFSQNLS
jgi:hypothetical protein